MLNLLRVCRSAILRGMTSKGKKGSAAAPEDMDQGCVSYSMLALRAACGMVHANSSNSVHFWARSTFILAETSEQCASLLFLHFRNKPLVRSENATLDTVSQSI